jgi:hypothetical protein
MRQPSDGLQAGWRSSNHAKMHSPRVCWRTLRASFCFRLPPVICSQQQSHEVSGEEEHGGRTPLLPWCCSSSTLKSFSCSQVVRRGQNSSRCRWPVRSWFSSARSPVRYCYDDGKQQAVSLLLTSFSQQREVTQVRCVLSLVHPASPAKSATPNAVLRRYTRRETPFTMSDWPASPHCFRRIRGWQILLVKTDIPRYTST